MAEPKNHYQILQVDPEAEPEVIAAAYHRLAKKYHPDTNKSPGATQTMQRINQAYEILKNPGSRADYDSELKKFAEAQKTARSPTENHPYQSPNQHYPKAPQSGEFYQASRETEYRPPPTAEWIVHEREKAANRQKKHNRYGKPQKNKSTNARLGWGSMVIYTVVITGLLIIFRSSINDIGGYVGLLVVALLVAIPFVLKLDDFLRK